MNRLRIAIAGLTACSGCQLTLLNCEDELPELLERYDFSYFPLACSPAVLTGEYDAVLVEGCVSMPHEVELLQEFRRRGRYLIALGSCAAWGGIPALRNGDDREQLRREVYGLNGCAAGTMEPVPLESFVAVDAVIAGCPPEKQELLQLLGGLLRGALPVAVDYPVCTECRMNENICLLMERHQLCLGPMTRGGCQARCPGMSVPCEGCRCPVPEANLPEFLSVCGRQGIDAAEVLSGLRRFYAGWRS